MKAFDGRVHAAAPLGVLNWDTVGMAIQGRYLGQGEEVGKGNTRVKTARWGIGPNDGDVVVTVCPTILKAKLDDFKLDGEWVAAVYRGKVKLKGGNFAKQFDVYALQGEPDSTGVYRPGSSPADPDASGDDDLPF